MKLTCLRTVAIATVLAAGTAFAGTPVIGVASAFGTFTANNYQVAGNSNAHNGVQALSYRIAADTPNARAEVPLRDGTVEVASMSGTVRLFDRSGAMLPRVSAGTASSFKPAQTDAGKGRGRKGNGNGHGDGDGHGNGNHNGDGDGNGHGNGHGGPPPTSR